MSDGRGPTLVSIVMTYDDGATATFALGEDCEVTLVSGLQAADRLELERGAGWPFGHDWMPRYPHAYAVVIAPGRRPESAEPLLTVRFPTPGGPPPDTTSSSTPTADERILR
jgi:hypothetical protein